MNRATSLSAKREQPARFSADEFMAMAAAGAFEEIAGKIELVEGVIVRMSPAHNPHFSYRRQLFLKLHELFGKGRDGFIVGQEPTIRLGEATVREPDVAILRDPGLMEGIIPANYVLLVAEVSDSSLSEDRGPKRLSYARAGISHYWVVDIRGRRIELMTAPEAGDYQSRRMCAFGDPLRVPGTGQHIIID